MSEIKIIKCETLNSEMRGLESAAIGEVPVRFDSSLIPNAIMCNHYQAEDRTCALKEAANGYLPCTFTYWESLRDPESA